MTLKFEQLGIQGLILIEPQKFGDSRGFFSETYNAEEFRSFGFHIPFVQDNHSFSAAAGTVRGLHFQLPPCAQDKLVRVSRGKILDVAVDIRKGSPTYGQHAAIELSANNWRQLLVPKGFAHGFCTMEPNTEVIYKVTSNYAPEHDSGILWNDPALRINWPDFAGAEISKKDLMLARLGDLDSPFSVEATKK